MVGQALIQVQRLAWVLVIISALVLVVLPLSDRVLLLCKHAVIDAHAMESLISVPLGRLAPQ